MTFIIIHIICFFAVHLFSEKKLVKLRDAIAFRIAIITKQTTPYPKVMSKISFDNLLRSNGWKMNKNRNTKESNKKEIVSLLFKDSFSGYG